MSITRKTKNQGNMKIRIKRRYRYFKVKNVVMILCLITISLMSGVIGAEFIIDKYVSDSLTGQTKDDSDYNNPVKNNYSVVLNKVSDSVVTVSDSEEKLSDNSYKAQNITGVIVNSNGYIITSLSRIQLFEKIFVKLSSKGSPITEAHLVGKDVSADIAVLKINNENLHPIEFAEKNTVKNGDNIIIVGNAIAGDYIGMCTSGIVTAINERMTEQNSVYSLIQTNAIINDYNTSGPICDMDGKLIGIASDNLSQKYNRQGLYYGISSANIKNLVENSISLESILGITGKEIDLDSSKNGLYIETLTPNGYAAKAGIKSSDILLSIDGKIIKSNEDVYESIKDKNSGDNSICDILRNGEKIKITIHFD